MRILAGSNSNLNLKALILKDSSVRPIWTYSTASPRSTTNTNKHDNTTNKYYKHKQLINAVSQFLQMCRNITIKAMFSHVRQVCRGRFRWNSASWPIMLWLRRLQCLLQLCLIHYRSFQRIQSFYILQYQDRYCSALTKQCFIGLVCSVFCCRCCYFNNLSTFSWSREIVLPVYVCGKPVYVYGKPVYVCGKLLITTVLSSLYVSFSSV